MSDTTTHGDSPVPPKLNLKQTGQHAPVINLAGSDRDAKKQTARVELPSTPPEPILKKKTSRIPLEQASAETGAATGSPSPGLGASKTIRLTSTSPTPTITIAPSSRAIPGALVMDDVKRQTSRIPLEAAVSDKGSASAGQETTPKTIRIKRPTAAPSISLPVVAAPPETAAAVHAPSAEPAEKSVTSRIDLPAEQEMPESGQATQRKTIKIRRAEGGPTSKQVPRSMAVARVEQEAASNAAAAMAGRVSPVFPILTAAAVLFLCVLVYVLFTQAFPNLDWNFPGKVTL